MLRKVRTDKKSDLQYRQANRIRVQRWGERQQNKNRIK